VARPRSSTSVWRRWPRARAPRHHAGRPDCRGASTSPPSAPPSARSPTCRRSRRAASRSMREAICSRWVWCFTRWRPEGCRFLAGVRRSFSRRSSKRTRSRRAS
jgi:hypothetical protein